MDIDSCHRVLDIDCGTGVATRAIAQGSKFRGRVTGIDLSPYLVDTAKHLAKVGGIRAKVEVPAGNTRSLVLPAKAFDAVVVHALLRHIR